MSGRHIRLRDDMESRFYRLSQFFACYLHERWPEMHGSPEGAIEAAIADHPLDLLQEVRRQLAALLAATDDDTRLRKMLNAGLSVNVHFRRPADARAFAEDTERRLLEAVRSRSADARGPKERS